MPSLDAQWMLVKKQKQKIIIWSKVDQKKKNKNHILIQKTPEAPKQQSYEFRSKPETPGAHERL